MNFLFTQLTLYSLLPYLSLLLQGLETVLPLNPSDKASFMHELNCPSAFAGRAENILTILVALEANTALLLAAAHLYNVIALNEVDVCHISKGQALTRLPAEIGLALIEVKDLKHAVLLLYDN